MDTTTNQRGNHWQFAFWTVLLLFVSFLLYQQVVSGMRWISLPGVFLSLGMLCQLSRRQVSGEWLRRSLAFTEWLLFALSVAVSVRLFMTL